LGRLVVGPLALVPRLALVARLVGPLLVAALVVVRLEPAPLVVAPLVDLAALVAAVVVALVAAMVALVALVAAGGGGRYHSEYTTANDVEKHRAATGQRRIVIAVARA
jgi:hypothetical protein